MTAILSGDGKIALLGDCPAADAEALLQLLTAERTAVVEWSGCTYAHAAVIQVLLAVRPKVQGRPANEFLARHVDNLLK